MSLAVPRQVIKSASISADPKQHIFDTVGHLKSVEVSGDGVLMGIYFRPEKTAGGIIRPDSNVEEDAFQGKVGLVLKLGPNAFRDENGELYEERFEVGDWAVFKVGDAWQVSVMGYPCRMARDIHLKMKIKDPAIIF